MGGEVFELIGEQNYKDSRNRNGMDSIDPKDES